LKNAYLAAIALVGTAAYANTVENVIKDTTLSPELKSRILAAVEAHCSDVLARVGLDHINGRN
jgi:hypothetical protein